MIHSKSCLWDLVYKGGNSSTQIWHTPCINWSLKWRMFSLHQILVLFSVTTHICKVDLCTMKIWPSLLQTLRDETTYTVIHTNHVYCTIGRTKNTKAVKNLNLCQLKQQKTQRNEKRGKAKYCWCKLHKQNQEFSASNWHLTYQPCCRTKQEYSQELWDLHPPTSKIFIKKKRKKKKGGGGEGERYETKFLLVSSHRLIKSQKTDCSNPHQDLGLIKIQFCWSLYPTVFMMLWTSLLLFFSSHKLQAKGQHKTKMCWQVHLNCKTRFWPT